jgi:YHS domain-containing protein
MVLDPVCTMDIDSVTAEAQSQYEGETVYFCSEECKRIFDADPEPYLDEIETAGDRAGQEP